MLIACPRVRAHVCARVCARVCVCVCAGTPKQLLFGELPAPRPRHGPKKRWRDVVSTDLADLGVTTWLESCQDRPGWRQVASSTPPPRPAPDPLLCVCGRPFRRPGDLKRHAKFCARVLT
eukprot:scpid14558/ scgid12480/ 